MVLMRPDELSEWYVVLAGAALIARAYFVTNPYVLVHLLGDSAVLSPT